MNYFERLNDIWQNKPLDYLGRLKDAKEAAFFEAIATNNTFNTFDDDTEITIYMRPYIRAILEHIEGATDGNEADIDRVLANCWRMFTLVKAEISEQVEETFNYEEDN